MRVFVYVIVFALSFALGGCKGGTEQGTAPGEKVSKKGPAAPVGDILGTWTGTDAKSGYKLNWEFKGDKSFSSVQVGQNETRISLGTYTFDGNAVKLHVTDLKASSPDLEKNEYMQKEIDVQKANLGKSADADIPVTFLDKNTMEMGTQKTPMILRRANSGGTSAAKK